MDMDLRLYSKPLNQGGMGFYSGSKFQNGGLVVYSGSRVQRGGLFTDKIIPAIKENIKKTYRKIVKPAVRKLGPSIVDKTAPLILDKVSKPISKAVGSDVRPLLQMLEPTLKKRAHNLIEQLGKKPPSSTKKRRKTIFDK